jgi:hypothetical protein
MKLWKELIRLRSVEGQRTKADLAQICTGVIFIRSVSDTISVMLFLLKPPADRDGPPCEHPRTTVWKINERFICLFIRAHRCPSWEADGSSFGQEMSPFWGKVLLLWSQGHSIRPNFELDHAKRFVHVCCSVLYGERLPTLPSNPQARGSNHVGCPRLLFEYIHSNLRIWRPSHPPATWGRAMPWWQGTNLTF